MIDVQTNSITAEFGYVVNANTRYYLNLDQSDGIFVDKSNYAHATTNNGIQYSSSGVVKGAGYNNQNLKRIISGMNDGETFPTQFTIMCFAKTTGNARSTDHPMCIAYSNDNAKVVRGIGFNQTNSQVMFNHLRENVARDSYAVGFSSLNARHHYALTFNGTTMIGYIDGVQKISANVSGSGSGSPIPTKGLTLFGRYITGKETDTNLSNVIQGYVDEAIAEDKVRSGTDIQNYLTKVHFL